MPVGTLPGDSDIRVQQASGAPISTISDNRVGALHLFTRLYSRNFVAEAQSLKACVSVSDSATWVVQLCSSYSSIVKCP